MGKDLAGRSQAVSPFESELTSRRRALVAYAQGLTRSREGAEDLVQDAMLKALQARGSFELGTSMMAWLRVITLNTFLDAVRRKKVMESITAGSDGDEWTSEATRRPSMDRESSASAAVQREVREMILGLPEEYAEIVALVDIAGLKYCEAAARAGCPLGTVMSRLHRGRKMLAERAAA